VLNILGERIAPWFLDWYPAKTGYGSQMTKRQRLAGSFAAGVGVAATGAALLRKR
jgi:hypothetical protein